MIKKKRLYCLEEASGAGLSNNNQFYVKIVLKKDFISASVEIAESARFGDRVAELYSFRKKPHVKEEETSFTIKMN